MRARARMGVCVCVVCCVGVGIRAIVNRCLTANALVYFYFIGVAKERKDGSIEEKKQERRDTERTWL